MDANKKNNILGNVDMGGWEFERSIHKTEGARNPLVMYPSHRMLVVCSVFIF